MIFNLADYLAKRLPDRALDYMYRRTPFSVMSALARHRFRQTLRWVARRSPFYQEAFRRHGIDPRDIRVPADMGAIFTTPEDIVRDPEKFLCSPPGIVFESSGTSGRNKQIYFDRAELDYLGTLMASGLRMMGVTRQDRVANAFDFSIWIPGMLFHQGLTQGGMFCQAFGKVDPLEVYRRLERYQFTVVLGEPTWLIRLTELAEQHGAFPLILLIGGAEDMPAKAIPWMQKVWQGAKVKMCYGSVEQGGGLGFQPCDNQHGYHMDDMNFLSEIMEPDQDGYGEIVFSTLNRRVMPLLRYRTRDVARIETAPCPCGLTAPLLSKLRGRRDDMVVASGGNLYPLMFENILADIPGLTHDWQVVFSLDGIREVMDIRVETARCDSEILERQIHLRAQDLYPDLIKNLALGIFQMKVSTYAPGALRTGRKLRRMIDHRHYAAVVADKVPVPDPVLV